MQVYTAIREDKNEELLKDLIRDKKLDVKEVNKEGMNPLILAVDCEFSISTLEYLIA